MTIATHLIKIKGEFDENWNEEKLRTFVKTKIMTEIDEYFHTDLELFQIKDNIIDVWVYLKALIEDSELENITAKWLKNHIKEEGITIKNLEIEKIPNRFGIILNKVSLENL